MNILFQCSWCDLEEGYRICIFEKDDKIFVKSSGHNVLRGDFDSIEEVSIDEAIAIMIEEEKNED